MCKFCENNEWIYFKSGLSMGINGNKIDFNYNTCACGSFEDEITIKYCPICGKKLRETYSTYDAIEKMIDKCDIESVVTGTQYRTLGKGKILSRALKDESEFTMADSITWEEINGEWYIIE